MMQLENVERLIANAIYSVICPFISHAHQFVYYSNNTSTVLAKQIFIGKFTPSSIAFTALNEQICSVKYNRILLDLAV